MEKFDEKDYDEWATLPARIIKENLPSNQILVPINIIKSKELSAVAKSVYFFLLTLAEDAYFMRDMIYKNFTDSQSTLDNAFLELIEAELIIDRGNGNLAIYEV